MSTMVFCESCGGGIDSSAKFCVQCGSAQNPTGSGATTPAVVGGGDTVATGSPELTATRATAAIRDAAPETEPTAPRAVSTASDRAPEPPCAGARAYTICAIREVADRPGEPEEGLFYPVGLEQRDSVALEARDGSNVKRLKCTAIEVAPVGGAKPLLRVKEISAQVLVTDARITVACTKYDKGGGWTGWGLGGVAVAVASNAASHALAARRRRGKMLVGQVRYPWINAVYAQNRVGFGGVEKLRVVASASGRGLLRVDLTLPKDVDACSVGTELIRRAAAFRLAHDAEPLADDEQRRLRELANVAPLKFVKGTGKMAGHEFPTCWPAGERSARFGLK